jgi:dTDP-glucose 4,6-dehydratase
MRDSLSTFQIFKSDLNYILEKMSNEMNTFNGKTISIFGATGFVGKWLTAALIDANQELNLNLTLNLFTRDGMRLRQMMGDKHCCRYNIITKDFSRDFEPEIPKSDYYFHLATSSTISTGSKYIKNVQDSTLNAINQTIKELKPANNPPIFIHASSGAVYGINQRFQDLILEGPTIERSSNNSIYCNVKISAETLIQNYTQKNLIFGMNPRLFTFAGPYLALNEHFAIGNFVQNLLNRESVVMNGNLETLRSYMYPADLVVWFLKLAINPTQKFLNFGSDKKIKIQTLAEMIANLGNLKVKKSFDENKNFSSYVPSTEIARNHLGIDTSISLETSLEKWITWLNYMKNVHTNN